MKRAEEKADRHSVKVSTFWETARELLALELVAGERGLKRTITEATLNRPGLALCGFFKYFAARRIQVIGSAEHSYLGSLSESERRKRLREFFAFKVPCVVMARGKKAFPEIEGLAEEFRVPVFKTHLVTKVFINAATIVMENLMAPCIRAQGTMVEIAGIGVLIEGRPGMGKSETALGLIRRGHALVSDDVTELRRDSSGSLIASPVSITRYHMEIRGLGIIHVPSLFGVGSVRSEKKLDLVATLMAPSECENEDRGGGERPVRTLLGIVVPQVLISVAPGRDIINVVETAALDQKLRRLGHDAAKELDEKLVRMLSAGRVGSE